MNSEYTILIVTWRRDDLLKSCLDSIVKSIDRPPACVVVDNAPLDSTKELCGEYAFVAYVAAPRNLGFAGGNDLGLPYCKTKYVCLLNNDTVIHEDSFSPLVSYLNSHENVGVVQGAMRLPLQGGVLDACGIKLTTLGKLHFCHKGELLADANLEAESVYSAKGAFMMVRREVIDELDGLLFHAFFFNNHEEVDFCHRVWLLGFEVKFVPTPPIDHLNNATSVLLPSPEVRAREMANVLFSFHTLWGWYGRLRIMPFFYLYRWLMILRSSAFKAAMQKAHELNRDKKGLMRQVRHAMQQKRVISDRELLKKVMYHPPGGYWLGMIKTWLKGAY